MQKNSKKLWVCLVIVFKNCLLFLKTKNTKNMFEEGDVFLLMQLIEPNSHRHIKKSILENTC